MRGLSWIILGSPEYKHSVFVREAEEDLTTMEEGKAMVPREGEIGVVWSQAKEGRRTSKT